MPSESYPEALAAITEVNTGEKEPEFLTEDEVSWNGELGYTGSLWREWINEEDEERAEEMNRLADRITKKKKSN